MQGWIKGKLEDLAKVFLGGEGSLVAFEAQYLAYMECLTAVRFGPDQAPAMWSAYEEWLQERSPDQEPGALSNTITDRQELADLLVQFRRKFEGPFINARAFKASLPQQGAQDEPKPRRESKSLVDFLIGDEE